MILILATKVRCHKDTGYRGYGNDPVWPSGKALGW